MYIYRHDASCIWRISARRGQLNVSVHHYDSQCTSSFRRHRGPTLQPKVLGSKLISTRLPEPRVHCLPKTMGSAAFCSSYLHLGQHAQAILAPLFTGPRINGIAGFPVASAAFCHMYLLLPTCKCYFEQRIRDMIAKCGIALTDMHAFEGISCKVSMLCTPILHNKPAKQIYAQVRYWKLVFLLGSQTYRTAAAHLHLHQLLFAYKA